MTVALFAIGAGAITFGADAAVLPRNFRCPAIVAMPSEMSIGTRYVGKSKDPTSSTLDPNKVAAQRTVRAAYDRPVLDIIKLASMWRSDEWASRRNEIGACLAAHFAALPSANAMAGATSDFDNYYRDWMLASLAVAYLKAQPALDSAPEAARVRDWFTKLARKSIAFHRARNAERQPDNHLYWGAAAIAAVSRIAADPEGHRFAAEVLAVGLAQVDQRGLMPAELARGKMARHYHIFAAVPLAAIGVLLDKPVASLNTAGMNRLIGSILDSFDSVDGGELARAAGAVQLPEDSRGSLAMLSPFVDHSPVRRVQLERAINGAKAYSYFLGGDLDFLLSLASAREDG